MQRGHYAMFRIICFNVCMLFCLQKDANAATEVVSVPSGWSSESVQQFKRQIGKDSKAGEYMEHFEVSPQILKRKGGIGSERRTLMLAGLVFVAPSLRRFFLLTNGSLNTRYDYEQVAVCEGHLDGPDLRNLSRGFSYFTCPKEEPEAARVNASLDDASMSGVRVYCCGPSGAQFCCQRADFFVGFGTPKDAVVGLGVKLIVVACVIVALLIFAGLISLIVCLCVVMPLRQRGLAKAPPPEPPPARMSKFLDRIFRPAATKTPPPEPLLARMVKFLGKIFRPTATKTPPQYPAGAKPPLHRSPSTLQPPLSKRPAPSTPLQRAPPPPFQLRPSLPSLPLRLPPPLPPLAAPASDTFVGTTSAISTSATVAAADTPASDTFVGTTSAISTSQWQK